MKRIRPAPMGRAFRYQRRISHIIVTVAEKKSATALAPMLRQPQGKEDCRQASGQESPHRQRRAPPVRRPAGGKGKKVFHAAAIVRFQQ